LFTENHDWAHVQIYIWLNIVLFFSKINYFGFSGVMQS